MNLITQHTEKTEDAKLLLKPAKHKILYQLLLILLLTSLIPLAVSDLVLIREYKTELETGLLEEQNNAARYLSFYTEQFFRKTITQLMIIAENEITGNLEQDIDRLGYLSNYDEIVQIYIQQGENVLGRIKDQGTPSLWQTSYMQEIYDNYQNNAISTPILSTPYQSQDGSELLVYFALPLKSYNGNFAELLVCEISLMPIINLVAIDEKTGLQDINLSSGKKWIAYIVDSQGKLVAHPNKEKALKQDNMAGVEIVNDYFLRGAPITGTIPFKDENGIIQLGSYKFLTVLSDYGIKDGLGWAVIVQSPREAAYYPIKKLRNMTILWSIGTTVFVVLLAIASANTITSPLRKFVMSAIRIARGNFNEKVDVQSSNEIGQLATTFNYMSEQLGIYDKAMKNLFLSTIKSLTEAIEAKDPYTRGHSERVTAYSLVIGKEMGLSDFEMEKLHIGGLLHDIGKIGIVDQVLNKRASFTDEEMAYMRTHPIRGAEIMKHIAQLKDIIPIMKYHHEWWNGKGYPEHLKGEEIPLLARIVCLADTYDAMTTDRPYQKGMDPNFVLTKVKEWSEIRYDPAVAEAFTRAFEKGQITNIDFDKVLTR